MGKYWGDYRWGGSSGVLEHKSGNISETRKDRWKVTTDYGEPIGTHRRSFERYHPRPPTASPSPTLGVNCSPNPKLQLLLSQKQVVTDCKFGRYIHRVHRNKSPWKILEKRERARIQGLPKFLEYSPIIMSGTSKAMNFKFGRYIHRFHPREQKPIKNLEEKGAWAYPETAQIFWVPLIISGTGKAMNFKFGRYIHRVR